MAAMLPAADRRGLGPAAQAVRRQFGIAGRGSPAKNVFRPTAIIASTEAPRDCHHTVISRLAVF
jgi:hypothetical protein